MYFRCIRYIANISIKLYGHDSCVDTVSSLGLQFFSIIYMFLTRCLKFSPSYCTDVERIQNAEKVNFLMITSQ